MRVLSGLISALLAATAYGVATVAQSVGVARMTAESRPELRWKLRSGWLYGAGMLLDVVGLLASVAALHTLPLFFVESAVASSVGVTAIVSVALTGIRLSRIETSALVTMMVGLVMLAGCAEPGPARGVGSAGHWGLLGAALVLAAITWAALHWTRVGRPAVLATAAGLGFAIVGISSRVLELRTPLWRNLDNPVVWALATAGIVGTVAFGSALVHAPATTVAAITFAVETSVPSIFGLWFLGDAVRPHMNAVAIAGFAATLAGCVSLARLADTDETVAQHHHHVTAS